MLTKLRIKQPIKIRKPIIIKEKYNLQSTSNESTRELCSKRLTENLQAPGTNDDYAERKMGSDTKSYRKGQKCPEINEAVVRAGSYRVGQAKKADIPTTLEQSVAREQQSIY